VAGSDRTIVAVVYADDAVWDSVRLLLEIAGHHVDVFASAAELLNTEARRFACLIVDHDMLRMTGLDLAARLRADGIAIPIMLATPTLTPAIRAQAAAFRVERVLEKPLVADGILAFVKEVHGM
jgi:FixJ family two-component response regulator